MRLRVLWVFALLVAVPSWAVDANPSAAIIEIGGRSVDIQAAVAKLPRQSISATAHGRTSTYEGYDLREVLKAAGLATAESLKGKQLTRLVRVSARDGYEAVFALADLDPTLGNAHILLADRENGQAMSPGDGPWRLVIPAEARPARWVRQVAVIRVTD
ncbi:molybdopterin-dependent oxidoreductase [Dyella sp. BiH032]|uniref:molybdopterin-dependent oxidoreductase n=1 Tax=Dyella sp. BiH032 TaxID=3075430 RepID=UPI00289352B1|nr:molybdopterin-dependent oxidoreductase [Dyella sp. BiH032]WNL44496.1 molybdopterin-dependent oxidoreductase [Dyella sp. BiH032]